MACAPLYMTSVTAADVKRGDGDMVVKFQESFCRIVKDGYAAKGGELIKLRPWQKSLAGAVYARRPDGRRKHRRALIGLPRKNSKSCQGSGFGLHALVTGGTGSEVYSCASDKDQARIVFGVAKKMVEMEPMLNYEQGGLIKCYRDVLEVPSTGSIYKVLSSEAFTKDGLNPTCVIYDELHAAPTDELYDVMNDAFGARRDPLFIAITTAGVKSDQTGGDSICYRLWQYGRSICLGEAEDDSFFFAWWGSKDDVDPSLRRSWENANPGFGDLLDPEDFESTYAQAEAKGTVNDFKALDVTTPVLTPEGWREIGDIQVGEYVYAVDGSPTRIVGASDTFTGRRCYEVELLDGRTLIADDQHRWLVENYHVNNNTRDWRYVTTGELRPGRHYIPVSGAIDLPGKDLPVDPYLFGYWLGDGSKNEPVIAIHKDDVPNLLSHVSDAGYYASIHKTSEVNTRHIYVSCSPVGPGGKNRDTLRRRLIKLGVHGDKHIPEEYLTASIAQRLELLRGLMDSDGTAAEGRCRFVNTNRDLAHGVMFLARSLGNKVACQEHENAFGKFWIVSWTANAAIPFALPRKVAKVIPAVSYAGKSAKVVSVTEVASRPTRCIAVEHPSQSFIAGRGLVVTANTKRLNMWVSQVKAWMPEGAWMRCRREFVFKAPPRGVVLGFDGSRNGDSTALVAVTVEPDPKIIVLGCWEKPLDKTAALDWHVPREDVKEKIRQACRDYNVVEVAADEYIWVGELEELLEEGIPVVSFPQTSMRMGPATQRFYELVTSQRISHDGNPALARHLGNAQIKTDARGSRLSKDARNSPRKIDLGVAAVMAVDRAGWWLTQDAPDTYMGVPVKQIHFVWLFQPSRVPHAERRILRIAPYVNAVIINGSARTAPVNFADSGAYYRMRYAARILVSPALEALVMRPAHALPSTRSTGASGSSPGSQSVQQHQHELLSCAGSSCCRSSWVRCASMSMLMTSPYPRNLP